MSNLSPVELFYERVETRKQEALLLAKLESNKPAKKRRGRPRKNKMYFTQDTEEAIVAYNSEQDVKLRNKVYSR